MLELSAVVSSPFSYAGPFTEAVLMGNLALRSYQLRVKKEKGGFYFPGRKKLLWDAENMKITNRPDIDAYIKEPVRKGWSYGEHL